MGPDHIEIASFIGLGAITGSDLTITDVRVTGDLQHASIFYTVYGTEEERRDSALALKARLLYRPNTVVTSVPVIVDEEHRTSSSM